MLLNLMIFRACLQPRLVVRAEEDDAPNATHFLSVGSEL